MVRDLLVEQQMRHDLGSIAGLSEKPMFDDLCLMLNGNALCAAREDKAMSRDSEINDFAALSLSGVSRMVHGGSAKGGCLWLDESHFHDDEIRAGLNGPCADERAQLAAEGVMEC